MWNVHCQSYWLIKTRKKKGNNRRSSNHQNITLLLFLNCSTNTTNRFTFHSQYADKWYSFFKHSKRGPTHFTQEHTLNPLQACGLRLENWKVDASLNRAQNKKKAHAHCFFFTVLINPRKVTHVTSRSSAAIGNGSTARHSRNSPPGG